MTPHVATRQQVSLMILVDHADVKIEIEYVGQLGWFGRQTIVNFHWLGCVPTSNSTRSSTKIHLTYKLKKKTD